MILDILARWFGRRNPRLGDVAAFADAADRQAARCEAMLRRRPPADAWLHQGGSEEQV
jgi:hypothetical protein